MGIVYDARIEEPATIEEVSAQMQALANRLEIPVDAVHEGVRLRAVPRGDPNELLARFAAAVAALDHIQRFATTIGGEFLTNPVPAVVSDRQFAQACAESGILTWPEAEEWAANGTIPAMLLSAIEKIADPSTRARTRIMVRSAKEYRRYSQMTIALGRALNKTDEEIDNLFRLAAVL